MILYYIIIIIILFVFVYLQSFIHIIHACNIYISFAHCREENRLAMIQQPNFGLPLAVRDSVSAVLCRCVCCRWQEMENSSASATEYVSRMMLPLVLLLVGVLYTSLSLSFISFFFFTWMIIMIIILLFNTCFIDIFRAQNQINLEYTFWEKEI